MKQLISLLPLFILMACGRTKTKDDRQIIDISKIDSIKICRKEDTAQNCKLLTSEQANVFAKKWNKAASTGPCKYIPLYWIELTLKDNTKRSFRVNGPDIKGEGDWCFDLGDSTYIEQLWTNAK